MKILLDCSPDKITRYRDKYDHDFWQLRTPLTKYAIGDTPWALDNGCFSEFNYPQWKRMVDDETSQPLWVTLPDMVGDATRTMDLFDHFLLQTNEVPRALVLQDGIGQHRIPWQHLSAVFVGGSDQFKVSSEAINACKTAKMLNKWVHVGRVNTPGRVQQWLGLADSIDGSGISRYDHMLEAVLIAIKDDHPQAALC